MFKYHKRTPNDGSLITNSQDKKYLNNNVDYLKLGWGKSSRRFYWGKNDI